MAASRPEAIVKGEVALLPLYGFLRGDTLGVLLLIQSDRRVRDLAELAKRSSAVRVAWSGEGRVVLDGRVLEPEATLAEAGVAPLDRIDVLPGDADV